MLTSDLMKSMISNTFIDNIDNTCTEILTRSLTKSTVTAFYIFQHSLNSVYTYNYPTVNWKLLLHILFAKIKVLKVLLECVWITMIVVYFIFSNQLLFMCTSLNKTQESEFIWYEQFCEDKKQQLQSCQVYSIFFQPHPIHYIH